PKLGPILMVLGAMGWLGVPIDMGTPMIAAVSMGLSVGFSIHYLYRFRQERAVGRAFHDALIATHRRVGGAMVFSNLALVGGFVAAWRASSAVTSRRTKRFASPLGSRHFNAWWSTQSKSVPTPWYACATTQRSLRPGLLKCSPTELR